MKTRSVGEVRTSAAEPAPAARTDRVWTLVAILVPTIAALASNMLVIDLAYLIRAGTWTLDGHGILRVDTFTYSVAGASWFNQQWAAEVVFAGIYRLGGWPSIVVARAALVGGAVALTAASCRARGASPPVAAALSLAGFMIAMPALAMRPQLVGVLLFALTLWLLSTRSAHPARVWFVPAVALVWANVHGSFVLAPLLVGLAWLDAVRVRDDDRRRLVVVGVLTVIGTFVTPFGPSVWSYAFDLSTNDVIRRFISEWQPLTFDGFGGYVFFAAALAVVWAIWRWRERTTWVDLIALGTFFLLALPARRGIIWFGMVAPVTLAGIVPPRAKARSAGSRVMDAVVTITLIGLTVAALPWWRDRPDEPVPPYLEFAPQGLVNAARASLTEGGHVFVTQPYASWFELAAEDMPVFLDSRIELFPPDLWDQYLSLQLVRDDWPDVIDRWDMTVVVLEPDWRLADRLRDDPDWHLVYEDPDGTVFARTSS